MNLQLFRAMSFRQFLVVGCLPVLMTTVPFTAQAQEHDPRTPPAVAAKVALRGSAAGIAVTEIRIVRRNDVLVAQADLLNTQRQDRRLYYRFKWLDSVGNQVGDGESWKQLGLLGMQQETVKSVAPGASASDFRVEMNIE